jgi:DNA ligase (NAD+)
MAVKDAKHRVEKLRRKIAEADYAYYVETEPIMSDRDYDALMKELEELEEAHPELRDPDSPTQRVSGEPISGSRRCAMPCRCCRSTIRIRSKNCGRGMGG